MVQTELVELVNNNNNNWQKGMFSFYSLYIPQFHNSQLVLLLISFFNVGVHPILIQFNFYFVKILLHLLHLKLLC